MYLVKLGFIIAIPYQLHSLRLWNIIIIKCAFFVNRVILKSMKHRSKRLFGPWINK